MIKKIGKIFAGKKKYQRVFGLLHQIALYGKNIGGNKDPNQSGERFVLEYINQQLQGTQHLTIFDVGAHVGHYSILLKDIFGNRAHIFSFEPSLKTFIKLQSNLKSCPNLVLYNWGFGEKDTKLTLYANTDESSLASVYQRRLDHFDMQMNKKEDVIIKTIDGFCSENNIKQIHLLKLDVEGHELSVLKGASEILSSGNIHFIQFEFGGCNIDSRTYFQDFFYLLKDNYNIYRIVKDGLYKIEKYKEIYETFITTNYLAEIRIQ